MTGGISKRSSCGISDRLSTGGPCERGLRVSRDVNFGRRTSDRDRSERFDAENDGGMRIL